MPPRRIGTCDTCGKHNVWTTFRMGFDPESMGIYTGWCCSDCMAALDALREEKRKAMEQRKG